MARLSFLSMTTCHIPMCSDSASASLSSTPLDEATHQQPLYPHTVASSPFVILRYSKDFLYRFASWFPGQRTSTVHCTRILYCFRLLCDVLSRSSDLSIVGCHALSSNCFHVHHPILPTPEYPHEEAEFGTKLLPCFVFV